MGGGYGGVAFMSERGGLELFVSQVFLRGGVLQGGGAAILQVVIKRLEVGLRNGNGCRQIIGWFGGGRKIGKMNGNGQRERRQDGGDCRSGLLRGLDGALLRGNRGQGGGELRIALFFAVGGLLKGDLLRRERGGELRGVAARSMPGIRKKGNSDKRYTEKDTVHSSIYHSHLGAKQFPAAWEFRGGGKLITAGLRESLFRNFISDLKFEISNRTTARWRRRRATLPRRSRPRIALSDDHSATGFEE